MEAAKKWRKDLTDLPAGTKVLIYDTPLDFQTAELLVKEIELINRGITRKDSGHGEETIEHAEQRKQRMLRCFKPLIATIDKFVGDAFIWRGYWIQFDHAGRDITYPAYTSLREDLENLHDPEKVGGEALIIDLVYHLTMSQRALDCVKNGGSLFQSAVQTTHDWIDPYSKPPGKMETSTRFQEPWNIVAYFDEDAQEWNFRPASFYDRFPGGGFDTEALDELQIDPAVRPGQATANSAVRLLGGANSNA
jgi:hypothetical protein